MNGYFSQVIKQTGISFPSPGNAGYCNSEQPLTRHEGYKDETSIHLNKEKPIEPQQGQADESIPVYAAKDSENLSHISKNNVIQHTIKDIPEYSLTQKPERNELLEQESVVLKSNVPASSGRVQSHQEVRKGELPESREAAGTSMSIRPGLEDVKNWIAGTPVRSSVGDEIQDAENQIPVSSGKKEILTAAFSPKQVEPYQREKSEIHDFHLSIGNISVTIEAPQKEIQNKEVPQVKGRMRSGQESTSSRLSRHYIRI
ncbi:MAG: hypothetical protein JETT_3271 [Candidatus Jettenia ecosi]|uniref:Uncharacterized protein n=1 Tax=Candidatus Jettenia ecosi TaxID=2494326 RepID=A0A533Q8D9_9BACT|nr:MAG: hypothetical protein JETT_3271 [Candidatus Jettenia ecosi]